MKSPIFFVVPLLIGLAAPVSAADPTGAPSPSLSDLGRSFKNALTEEETSLLIEYMRDSVLAAFNDEEVSLPPDLAFKLAVLEQRLKKESNYYLDNFLKQLEEDIKRSLKEKMEVPPAQPYTPPPASVVAPPEPPAPGYILTPWGYVPWFVLPQTNYTTPAYTPPELPRYNPPATNNAK
jgi:hypothetical protein